MSARDRAVILPAVGIEEMKYVLFNEALVP